MAFDDEFQTALAGLKTVQTKQFREQLRVDHPPLTSERAPQDLYDLLVELRSLLQELWDKGQLSLAPVPVKRSLHNVTAKLAEGVSQFLQGNIPLQEVENRTDTLHTVLWQNNLYDRGDRLAGFDVKNERYEFLKNKGRRIIRELEKGLSRRDAIVKAEADASKKVESAGALLKEIQGYSSTAEQAKVGVETTLSASTSSLASVQRLAEQAEALEQRARAATTEAETTRTKVITFFGQIESNQAKLEEAVTVAADTVEEIRSKITDHEETLTGLETEVTLQLQKATGASLFHAFHERKKAITLAKWIWAGASGLSLLFSVWWGVYLAESAGEMVDQLFWVKLSATVPLLALVVFALSQYGRERRAEEDYAFKSALSLSLVPYKELIESIDEADRKSSYAEFLVRTIGQIYSPPSGMQDRSDTDSIPLAPIQQVTKLVEKVVNR